MSSLQRPTVSVCIPTYNRAELLREAVDSVLAQTFRDFELIISDNGSTDETPSRMRAYTDPRIRYTRNKHNLGVYGNYERCLALAAGRYIGFLPDDDLMLPENLARKVAILERHPNVGLVHSRYHLIGRGGEVMIPATNWGHGPTREEDAIDRGTNLLRLMLLSYNRINEPTVVFRRECYEKLGGFKANLPYTFDWEYWMRIATHYDVAYLAEPLVQWRFHAGALTSSHVVNAQTLTPLGLREQLLAKHVALNGCRGRIPDHPALAARVYASMADQLWNHVDRSLHRVGPTPASLKLLLGVLLHIPALARHGAVSRALGKAFLGSRPSNFLRQLFTPVKRPVL